MTTLLDRFEGKRLNRPNDVICGSDGSILFTDPSLRVPLAERELEHAAVYRIAPDGAVVMVAGSNIRTAWRCRPTSGLSMWRTRAGPKYIHAIELDGAGKMVRRRIFAECPQTEQMASLTA